MKESIYKEQAKERQLSTLKQNQDTDTPNSGERGETIKLLAKEAGIGHDTLDKIKKLQEKAAPEVLAELRSGDTTINAEYRKLQASTVEFVA